MMKPSQCLFTLSGFRCIWYEEQRHSNILVNHKHGKKSRNLTAQKTFGGTDDLFWEWLFLVFIIYLQFLALSTVWTQLLNFQQNLTQNSLYDGTDFCRVAPGRFSHKCEFCVSCWSLDRRPSYISCIWDKKRGKSWEWFTEIQWRICKSSARRYIKNSIPLICYVQSEV